MYCSRCLLMIWISFLIQRLRPPAATPRYWCAASDVDKRQHHTLLQCADLPEHVIRQVLNVEPNRHLQQLGEVRNQNACPHRSCSYHSLVWISQFHSFACFLQKYVFACMLCIQVTETPGMLTRTYFSSAHKRAAQKVCVLRR